MISGTLPEGLRLTEEEAYALLTMCLTSPHKLDADSEAALRKLAEYCSSYRSHNKIIDIEQLNASSA